MLIKEATMRRSFVDFFDYGFLTCLVFAAVLGGDIVPFFVVFGVVPAILFSFKGEKWNLLIPLWVVVAPVGLYLSYSTAVMFIYPGLDPGMLRPVNPDIELYAVAAALFVVGLIRSLQIKELAVKTRFFLPWALFALFIVLTVLMFSGIRDGCRVRGSASWPFIPAILFSMLVILSLIGWVSMSLMERRVRLALVSMSIVVVVGFTGSRGVAVGLAAVLIFLGISSLRPSLHDQVPSIKHLISAALIGVMGCLLVEAATGCGVLERVASIIQPASVIPNAVSSVTETTSDVSQSVQVLTQSVADQSTSLRLQMWGAALDAIREKPLLGHGAFSLKAIIEDTFGFQHPHNQYLAWMVTGGIISLTIGFILMLWVFFLSPFVLSSERVILWSAVPLLWGISMMFDAFLSLDFYLHYFTIIAAFIFSLCNDRQKGS